MSGGEERRGMHGHYLMLDGWQHRRQPVHWQGWLAERLVAEGATVDYPTLPDPERPAAAAWTSAVLRALEGREDVTVVAHGLSTLLWLRMCLEQRGRMPRVRRALLVAPPSPGAHGGDVSLPLPNGLEARHVSEAAEEGATLLLPERDPFRAGDDPIDRELGLEIVRLPGEGHRNTADGHGPWPEVLVWCRTGRWPAPGVLAEELAEHYTPHGRRLGILVAGALDAQDDAAVDGAVAASGQLPQRRVARLQPRVGEASLRAEDVVDFARRYGHEYSVAVLAGAVAHDPGVGAVRRALVDEGVVVLARPQGRGEYD